MENTNVTRSSPSMAANINKDAPSSVSSRRVLGDVSPNVRKVAPASYFNNKPIAGSPLKRSFTAAIEGGQGFTYLKKRKGSFESSVSQVDGQIEHARVQPIRTSSLSPNMQATQQASPTELNTPTPSEECNDEAAQGASQLDLESFSSLINYDDSSQPGPASQVLQSGSRLLFNGPSVTELLRLRLQVAMYKVRTNQIHIPFVDLQIVEDETEESADGLPEADSVETIVAARRQEAQQSADAEQRPIPKLLPAPVLLPTAYSSRMLYHDPTSLPSSPPVMRSPERPVLTAERSTPAKTRILDEQELTSSAVKGSIAEGLLGLRNAI